MRLPARFAGLVSTGSRLLQDAVSHLLVSSPWLQTPHRFRSKRQLWAYSGFAGATAASHQGVGSLSQYGSGTVDHRARASAQHFIWRLQVADSKWLDRPEKLVNKHLILERCPLGELTMVGLELRRAGSRWRVTKPALSIARECQFFGARARRSLAAIFTKSARESAFILRIT